MPRIRTIKPEFWASEALGTRLPGPDGRQARLLFIAMWNHAEDHGVCRASPALLRSVAFPYDEDVTAADVARWLNLLAAGGFVVRFERQGSAYAWVRGFDEHQKIDRKSKTTLPEPSQQEIEARSSPRTASNSLANETVVAAASPRRALDEPSPQEGKGREGKVEERRGEDPPNPPGGFGTPLELFAPQELNGWTLPDAVDAVHREVMDGRPYRWDVVADEKAATVLMSLCTGEGIPIHEVPEETGRRFGRALVRSLWKFERGAGKAVSLRELARRECWSINADPPRQEREARNGISGVMERVEVAVEPWDAMLAKREVA